ncbi:ABC transporter ATP-binding protein [Methanobrevibacter curvatus]|uniref:Teichoic acids export ATP-binding protein TagH n=1 Tax=Methanobrevibacter curvatus TaxID=49547 RepID=A0A166A1X6_9EURY|nr:ABC transporter ATP-binding protein [Methanobrevibacter curvatus]KZX11462.1 teichoic acids export ATP-binding protein TagH [Methanobrevibacter curvatus]
MIFSKNNDKKNKKNDKDKNEEKNKEKNKEKTNFPEYVKKYYDDDNKLLFIYDSKKIAIGQNPEYPMEFLEKGANGFPKEIVLYEKLKKGKNDISIKHLFKYDFEKNEYIKDLNEIKRLEEIKNLNDLKKLVEFNDLKTTISEKQSQKNKSGLNKEKLNKEELNKKELNDKETDKKNKTEEVKFNSKNLLVKKPNVKYAIEVRNVSMVFKLFSEKLDNIKEYAIKKIKGQAKKQEFHALSDVSFLIEKGDRLGIIGLNGAGKSTLLKIISGVMKPTKGKIIVRGKITPLLELGAGFDPNYTGRENIFLNGSILGFSREFLESKFEEIVEYSDLGKFIEVPVKNYSSGMKAKLGFSISTVLNPEILILDEVLSVGDLKFKKKADARIRELFESGATIILVSHSIKQIKKLCNKCLWLDQGKLKMFGETKEVCDTYERINTEEKKKKAKPKTPVKTPVKNKETVKAKKKEDIDEPKKIKEIKEKGEMQKEENKEESKKENKEEQSNNIENPEETKEISKTAETIEDPGVIQLKKIKKTMQELEEKIAGLTNEEEIEEIKEKTVPKENPEN